MGFFKKAIGAVSTGGLSLLGGGMGDTLFGDQGEGAASAQAGQNAADRAFFAKQAEKARADAVPLFGRAQEQRGLSAQQGLDVLGGSIPAQLQAFQGGNVAAQQALLGGQFTPQQLQVDTSFIPQQVAQPQLGTEETIAAAGAAKELTDIDTQLADLQSKFDEGASRGFNDDRGFFTNLERSIRELTRKRSLLDTDTAAPVRQFHQVNGSAVRV